MFDNQPWNNFVMANEPADHASGSERRAAAIACQYMSLANNGGLNSFLTSTYDLDAAEVVQSLMVIGAPKAADQLSTVVSGLGCSLAVSSQEERWHLLDRYWTDVLDPFDVLWEEADAEIMSALQRHVRQHEDFYRALG